MLLTPYVSNGKEALIATTQTRIVCLGACLREINQYVQVVDLTSFLDWSNNKG